MIRQKIFGEAHADVATSFNSLAWVYESLGEYHQAKELFEKALVIRKKSFGEDHASVKCSQDRCKDNYNQIWVKPPFFFVLDTIMTGNESMYVLYQSSPGVPGVNDPPWVPETFLARFPVSALLLVASAYDRRCVFRLTPHILAAHEKNLWYPGYDTMIQIL